MSAIGRILEILTTDEQGNNPIIVLDVFQLGATRHETFGMPTLARRLSETTFLIVPAKVLLFIYLFVYSN
jgi:hypothetical protein